MFTFKVQRTINVTTSYLGQLRLQLQIIIQHSDPDLSKRPCITTGIIVPAKYHITPLLLDFLELQIQNMSSVFGRCTRNGTYTLRVHENPVIQVERLVINSFDSLYLGIELLTHAHG